MNPPLRLLLVEDHVPTNTTLTRLLGAEHAVLSATTAARALELARAEPVDVVIADIGLPDQTGWDVVREIRKMRPEVHAIALTGVDYAEDPHRFSEAGFDMHLSKPVELSKIRSALQTLCPDRA